MIIIKQKSKTKRRLNVLTEQDFEKMLKNLQGRGVVIESGSRDVVVEHPGKKYCIQFNLQGEAPRLPEKCVLDKIAMKDAEEEATFKSKGGRVYKIQIGTIFLFPC
jgi:hypothetical protein